MKNRVLLTIALTTAPGPALWTAPALTPAWAQNVKITTPEATREPRVVTPGLLYEKRPDGDLYYLGIPPSVRIGLSGWTSPNPAIGSSGTGQREINGWLGFGVSWTWGGHPPARWPGAPVETPATSKP